MPLSTPEPVSSAAIASTPEPEPPGGCGIPTARRSTGGRAATTALGVHRPTALAAVTGGNVIAHVGSSGGREARCALARGALGIQGVGHARGDGRTAPATSTTRMMRTAAARGMVAASPGDVFGVLVQAGVARRHAVVPPVPRERGRGEHQQGPDRKCGHKFLHGFEYGRRAAFLTHRERSGRLGGGLGIQVSAELAQRAGEDLLDVRETQPGEFGDLRTGEIAAEAQREDFPLDGRARSRAPPRARERLPARSRWYPPHARGLIPPSRAQRGSPGDSSGRFDSDR